MNDDYLSYNICKCNKCGCEYACRNFKTIPVHKCPRCGNRSPKIVRTEYHDPDWFTSDFAYVEISENNTFI